MFALVVTAATVVAAASWGLLAMRSRALAKAVAARFGLDVSGSTVTGLVNGHNVRVRCDSPHTEITVGPDRHAADRLKFRPATDALDQFEIGIAGPMTGDPVIDERYVFTGDPLDIAAFSTPDVRRRMIGVECKWTGVVLRKQIGNHGADALGFTLTRLLELADAMAAASGTWAERVQQAALCDPDTCVRDHVLHTYLLRKPDTAPDVAREALRDDVFAIRCLAMFHLPSDSYPAPEEGELLEVALGHVPENGRRAAIHLLGRFGSLEVVPAINRLKADRVLRRHVEIAVARLLERHGAAEGRVSLVDSERRGDLSEVEAGLISPPTSD